ncbi:hypothetical protein [Leeuwenhoekiella nanhaiensis]|nr:hypothetical protein [Leeuwenhoekiella nanhaiensis]
MKCIIENSEGKFLLFFNFQTIIKKEELFKEAVLKQFETTEELNSFF